MNQDVTTSQDPKNNIVAAQMTNPSALMVTTDTEEHMTDAAPLAGRSGARSKRKAGETLGRSTASKKTKNATIKTTQKATETCGLRVGEDSDAQAKPHTTVERAESKDDHSRSCTIADLLTAPNGAWRLEARVVARSCTTSWVGVWGEGKKFDFFLADKSGEVIKAAMFNKGVDAFDSVVKAGVTFVFSTGRVKKANPVYSAYQVELTFDERAVIVESVSIPQVSIPCISIEAILDASAGSKVTIIGVVAMVGSIRTMVTKKQTVCQKREFLVVDSTMRKVVGTRWAKQAEEDISDCVGKVVIVTRADLNEYQGMHSLSLGPSASVLFDPDVVETSSIQEWYKTVQDLSNFTFV